MNFRLELAVKSLPVSINIKDEIALVGSCFTSHMGSRLRTMKYRVLENPNGVIFNPMSIEQAVMDYILQNEYKPAALFYHNELWQSWQFHGQFAQPEMEKCLQGINAAIANAHVFLKQANWLIVTLGSAFVYELKNETLGGKEGMVVANCHKVAANHFQHRLAALPEVANSLQNMIKALQVFNPTLKIIFTISPVRHFREGLIENNRSKGTLHLAVSQMLQQFEHCYYFPAYELVIDDLRDYRYYAEDMVHPNFAATQYVWEKFVQSCIDETSNTLMKQLDQIRIAVQHRPHHPGSSMHQQFLATMQQKTMQLHSQYPFLNLSEELAYFGSALL